jgi:hypothetical protein
MTHRFLLISQCRTLFEQRKIDLRLLAELYVAYNPIPAIESFITQSQALFPKLNCGLASLYLRHILKEGVVKQGTYAGHAHTYLLFEQNLIADITADQYGGPRIYYGPLKDPWKLEHPLDSS